MTRLQTIAAATLLGLGLFGGGGALAAPAAMTGLVPKSAIAADPAPAPAYSPPAPASGSGYWVETIERSGEAVFGPGGYQIFRNVRDFGAVGDGVADDTDAINRAISSPGRCGLGCDSSTTTPALVYFPSGTYKVSRPIVMYYYSQLIGDALHRPVLQASADFTGMAVIDSDPYEPSGANWYTNQNNFFRQVRNFVIDLTQMPITSGAGIHWQVAQATSLQNIRFQMHVDSSEANKQTGIFMDNGSGGFMADLDFVGGNIGAFFGSQQFTTRNLTFTGCRTAVYMNWNWVWVLHGLSINNCGVGIDMANRGASGEQTVGSVVLIDSTIANTPVGVATAFDLGSAFTNGSLAIENVDMTNNVRAAVAVVGDATMTPILAGNARIDSFVQGRVYGGAAPPAGHAVQDAPAAPARPAGLLDGAGRVFARSRPQYENVPASGFASVKAAGAAGDGQTDDTDAIQRALDAASSSGKIVYFDHGAYLVTRTVNVPKNVRITGELWPMIMAAGNGTGASVFGDQANPQPVFRVGQPGDVGAVEISDLIFETRGPQPGAIMMEWNVEAKSAGAAGMWDTHFRIGGTAGTLLQSDRCAKTPDVATTPDPACHGAFLLLHVTKSGSAYLENNWFWVADHELDLGDHNQINIFSGRGVLIESTKPTWLWGTSSEHSVLYNFQVAEAKDLFMSMIQTETAYFQGNPDARTPFAATAAFADPDFTAICAALGESGSGSGNCARTAGLRVTDSTDILVYGGGLYSFFDNYGQTCLKSQSCQTDMVYVDGSERVRMLGVSTKAAVNMLRLNGASVALDADNRNNFCATIAMFSTQ